VKRALVATWYEVHVDVPWEWTPLARARKVSRSRPDPIYVGASLERTREWVTWYRADFPALGKKARVVRVRRYRKGKP
jgi:hypothetical protein